MNITLPNEPKFKLKSPELVLALDKIRFKLEEQNTDEYAEFCWFAREYPRCFRHYYECAEFRLKNIIEIYKKYSKILNKEIENKDNEDESLLFEISQSNIEIKTIYWEFESYLASISTSLDIMTRICGLENKNQTSLSFSRYCKNSSKISEIFKEANDKWVSEMKNYRDCFAHYTPVDTLPTIKAVRDKNNWKIMCKIPDNPNSRDILNFQYSKKKDLLKYALKIYRNYNKLDKAVSIEILKLYKNNQFPVRIANLFNIGIRE